ncbi:MAG: DUF5320 domain-containing protein [Candidatus Geothermincolia bacterium]
MKEEQEQLLKQETEAYDRELNQLANRLQELAGVDCSFGACVLDPQMTEVEDQLAEIQKRRRLVEEIMDSVRACST